LLYVKYETLRKRARTIQNHVYAKIKSHIILCSFIMYLLEIRIEMGQLYNFLMD